jgi:hypothetical protein
VPPEAAPNRPGARGGDERRAGDDERDPKADVKGGAEPEEGELLDPMQRVLLHDGGWARPEATAGAGGKGPGAAAGPALPVPTLDSLVDRFLRRVAFSGGRQRGVAHLEIGSGELAGASLTINAEGEHLELTLDTPPGVDPEPYRALLTTRLAAKGVRAVVNVK